MAETPTDDRPCQPCAVRAFAQVSGCRLREIWMDHTTGVSFGEFAANFVAAHHRQYHLEGTDHA